MKTTRYRGRAARSRYGFTLIEVTIALMVFTLLTLLFVASIPTSRRSSRLNTQYAQAISLCQHKIDQLRAVGYGRLTASELVTPNIIDNTTLVSGKGYSFVSDDSVAAVLPEPTAYILITDVATNTRQVTVTITWRNADQNKTSTMALTALIANVD